MAAPPPLSLLLDGLRVVERHFAPRGAGAVDLGRRALNQSGFEALVSGRHKALMDGDAVVVDLRELEHDVTKADIRALTAALQHGRTAPRSRAMAAIYAFMDHFNLSWVAVQLSSVRFESTRVAGGT